MQGTDSLCKGGKMSSLFLILAALVFIVALAAIAAQKGRLSSGSVEEPAFEGHKELFSPAERSFLGVLEQATEGELKVFGKVRLGDLIQPARGLSKSRRTGLRNRIQQKHVDFVLCRPDTLAVVGVVELDDASHGRKDRAERDDFVDKALASAGVPVLRFPARKAYAVTEVRERLAGGLGLWEPERQAPKEPEAVKAVEVEAPTVSAAQEPAGAGDVPTAVEASAEEPAAPACPACNSVMIRRQAKKGPHAGKWFWACSEFPRCRMVEAEGGVK